MNAGCGLKKREKLFRSFWEMKAKKYPQPFDQETLKKTNAVIAMVKNKGVDTAGKRILDIGCGTGIYTLPLAREALQVTGIDFSKTMLTRLQDEARRHGIVNIDVIESPWQSLDVSLMKLAKFFDITWSAMSMAIKNEEDLEKMEICSKNWCVYIGWGSVRKNTLLEEVFNLHGMQFEPPQGASAIYEMLKSMGRNPSLDFFDTSWDWEGTIDEAVEDIAGHIEVHGVTAQRLEILEVVARYAQDGKVRHTTQAEEGLVVWNVGKESL